MIRTFRYRIYPNVNQTRELEIMLETHRRLYNYCLEMKTMAWECCGANINYFDLTKWFTNVRLENSYYARLNVQSVHTVFQRLILAFDGFFRRAKAGKKPGYPRFKGKNRFTIIGFGVNGYRILADRSLRVQYAGDIKIKLHRPIGGKIKSMSLHAEAGKWFACFLCELPDVPLRDTGKPAAGIDVGLSQFLTASDGTAEPNPRYLKTSLPVLRRDDRSVARKKRGGANRRKAIKVLARAYARVRNLRREHHHKTALRLVRRYGFIAVESLNIQGMMGNRRLSRAIADAGWASFLQVLKCKAENAGIRVIEVNPNGTSQQCSNCGEKVPKNLGVRWHDCPHCGTSLDRDHNAAKNILARGLARIGPAKANVGQKAKRFSRSRSRKAEA